MVSRQFSAGSAYRYGFNGKENDNELKGIGNSLDFGARIYDPRIGNWFSTDPVVKPWLSSYQYASNNPVNLSDPDGGDEIHFHYYTVATKVPTKIIGEDGVPRIVNRTVYQTYRWLEIVKDNNKDRFFVHRKGLIPKPETIEFYPNSAERTKSGATSTSYLFNSFTINDDDYTSLQKLADDFPGLKNQVLEAQLDASNSGWSTHKGNRAFWQSFYNNLGAKKRREAEQAQVDNLMLGIIVGATTEVLLTRALFTATIQRGRLGNATTRSQIESIASELESRGYTITGGGGRMPEEYLKPLSGGRKGGSYVDITAIKDGKTLRINTVDIYKNGKPTLRELRNAARIRQQTPGDHLLLIPKN